MSLQEKRDADEIVAEIQPEGHSMARVVFAIVLYCTVSISIVFLNRQLFSQTFKYPIFISWFQQIFGFTCFATLGILRKWCPSIRFLPALKFELSMLRKVLPLSLAFVGMIGFSNTCLKYVQVSTYQVARSLTLLFNLILSSLYLKMHISLRSWTACMVVISGFIIGSLDPSTLSVFGIWTGAASSVFQAIYMVSIKKALSLVDNDENQLLCYNLFLSSFLFVPVILVTGEGGFYHELPFDFADRMTWIVWISLLASAILGICLTFATYFCVRVTSPVTYNVTGYAKACIQSLGGILFLGEIVNFKSGSGIVLTLLGSFWYSRVKMTEMRQASANKIAYHRPPNESDSPLSDGVCLDKLELGQLSSSGRLEETTASSSSSRDE